MSGLDVAIVGGGPAGLATAIELRLKGVELALFDGSRPPIDKACGEGIMPDGVRRLVQMGVDTAPTGAFPLRGIRYLDDERVAQADFPSAPGLGIRRTRLHSAMVERALDLGVRCRWGESVQGLTAEGVETEGGVTSARWVVGADGLHSRVRQWAGLGGTSVKSVATGGRFGVRRHYEAEPWSDRVEVYWGAGAEAYVTPVGEREVGVAMLWSGARSGFDSLLARFGALGSRLSGCRAVSSDRGAGPMDQRCGSVATSRVALVGDAAGYRDAITGEGLSLAFHQAEAVAAAIEKGDLSDYGRAHRSLVKIPFALIRAMLFLERKPGLRARWVETMARDPRLFRRLVAIHCRELAPHRLGLRPFFRLTLGLAGVR